MYFHLTFRKLLKLSDDSCLLFYSPCLMNLLILLSLLTVLPMWLFKTYADIFLSYIYIYSIMGYQQSVFKPVLTDFLAQAVNNTGILSFCKDDRVNRGNSTYKSRSYRATLAFIWRHVSNHLTKVQCSLTFLICFGLHHLLRKIFLSLAAKCFTVFTS